MARRRSKRLHPPASIPADHGPGPCRVREAIMSRDASQPDPATVKALKALAREIRHQMLAGLPIRKVFIEPRTGRVTIEFSPKRGGDKGMTVRQSIIARFAALKGWRIDPIHEPNRISGWVTSIPRAGVLSWAEKAGWAMRPFG